MFSFFFFSTRPTFLFLSSQISNLQLTVNPQLIPREAYLFQRHLWEGAGAYLIKQRRWYQFS